MRPYFCALDNSFVWVYNWARLTNQKIPLKSGGKRRNEMNFFGYATVFVFVIFVMVFAMAAVGIGGGRVRLGIAFSLFPILALIFLFAFFSAGCSLTVAGRPVFVDDDGNGGVLSRTVGGAAVGAAAGAVGGAIAGNPGKGAAIGAAAGGVVGFLSGVFGGLEWSCDRLPEGPRRQGCLEGLAERQAYLACLESASGYCAGNPGSYECSRRRWECRVTHGRHYYGGGWDGWPRYYRD